jgi:hypothetical protein
MPYAADGQISRDPIPSGIEITEQQYVAALEGMLAGDVVSTDGGFSVGPAPEPLPEAAPEPTPDQVLAGFLHSIQSLLDAPARQLGYDSIASAITYAEEPSAPKFQVEGQAFRAWRSLVWAYSYDQLAKVEAGQRPQPTIEQFLSELPPLDLPKQ